MSGPIKVLLVDDHPVVRRGIAFCLERDPRVKIIGEAADGREALAKARQLLPKVVLMDIEMPRLNGLRAAEILRAELPQINVLMLSTHQHAEYISRALKSGAQGYLLKNAAPEELITAVTAAAAGETYFSHEITRIALTWIAKRGGGGSDPRELSRREREVLGQIAEGCSNKEIAINLGMGVRTVETHRERIRRKLDVHSVPGLTRFAIANGVVALREGSLPARQGISLPRNSPQN